MKSTNSPLFSILSFFGLLTLTPAPLYAQVSQLTRVTEGEAGFVDDLEAFDLFGWSVANIGDVNGDGIADLATSSFLDDEGAPDSGAVWVLLMEPEGHVMHSTKIGAGLGGLTEIIEPADFFGTAIASVGDLDGDGTPDMAVSAYYDDDGGPDKGAVYILFLHPDGAVKSSTKISEISGGFSGGLESVDWFGWAMAGMGDMDEDGTFELAVAADGDDDGGDDTGAVYILSLASDGTVVSDTKISMLSGGFGGPLVDGNWFGSSLANLGDLDGDGVTDLAVGADGIDAGTGEVWILFMLPDGTVKAETKIGDGAGGLMTPLTMGDQFGRGMCALGDIDGDGIPDLAVGADHTVVSEFEEGAVYLLTLMPDGTVKGEGRLDASTCGLDGAPVGGAHFGNAMAIRGDYDGDGMPELAVGAEGSFIDGNPGQGCVWMITLNTDDCNGNGVSDICDITSGTSSDLNLNGVPDECEELGESYCDNAPNSTGLPGVVMAHGSKVVSENDFYVTAAQLPAAEFGYFLASPNSQLIVMPGGSAGDLCVGGDISRFTALTDSSSAEGSITKKLDLTAFPSNPDVAVVAGEEWNFQMWYRDGAFGGSNFTGAVAVTFE